MKRMSVIGIILTLIMLIALPLGLLISDDSENKIATTPDENSKQGDFSMELNTIYKSTLSNYSKGEMDFFLITNKDELLEIYKKYLRVSIGEKMPFEVNFDKEVIVVIFMGQRTSGGHSIETVKSALVRNKGLNLKVVTKSPEEGAMVTMQMTSPCVVVSLKREGLKFFNRIDLISGVEVILSKNVSIDYDLHIEPLLAGIMSKYESERPSLIVISNEEELKKVLSKYFDKISREDVLRITNRRSLKKISDFSFKENMIILSMFGKVTKEKSTVCEIESGASIEGNKLILYTDTESSPTVKVFKDDKNELFSPFSFLSVKRKDIGKIDSIVLLDRATNKIVSKAKSR